ncbi:hypothetical protein [Gemella cuniculi]|uniref:hypothetical protein n=1 Tax=Gemella cuniculi TaxID=150240 RepID=UPI00048585FC|nr:hypothetical protein [Gemella cuniculi]
MNDEKKLKVTITVLLSLLLLAISGHFKFIFGVICSVFPLLFVLIYFHNVEKSKLKTDNFLMICLLNSRLLLRIIALFSAIVLLLEIMFNFEFNLSNILVTLLPCIGILDSIIQLIILILSKWGIKN